MVVGACIAAIDLLLRSLCVCEYHGPRDRDVYAFPYRHIGRWNADLSGDSFPGLLLQSRRILNPLWNHARADLLWRRLYNATYLVDARTNYFSSDYCSLEFGRFHVVEGFGTLVTNYGWILFNTLSKETWYQRRISNHADQCS